MTTVVLEKTRKAGEKPFTDEEVKGYIELLRTRFPDKELACVRLETIEGGMVNVQFVFQGENEVVLRRI